VYIIYLLKTWTVQVCVKNNLNLSYVSSMVRHVMTVIENPKDRQTFFSSIYDMFKELIIDIHEFGKRT